MKPVMDIINTEKLIPKFSVAKDQAELSVYPRIHMFTFDLSLISGILRHGSLGLSLKNMPIVITVKKANIDSIRSKNIDEKNLDFDIDLKKLRKYLKTDDHYEIFIDKSSLAREHSGLGLSTQIIGGVYLCCAKISGFNLTKNDLFQLGLGHYSTLGLSLLFTPGMIFEMGVKETDKEIGLTIIPGLSKKYERPANTVIKINKFPYYTIVAIPKRQQSISGEYEINFWNKSLPDKNNDSYKIIYNVFENIIPSIVENDFSIFVRSLKENITLGSKPLEEAVQIERTKEVLTIFREKFKFAAISSLGPTIYSFSEEDPTKKIESLNIDDYDIFLYAPNGKVKQKICKSESLLIASFACMGKTTFARKNPDIAVDIESIHYARKYQDKHPDDEIAKGDENWKPNEQYPENYISAVMENYGKKKIIFLTAAADVLSQLDKMNIKYIVLYPGDNRKSQVLNDAKTRGNSPEFIKMLDDMMSNNSHLQSFMDLNCEKVVMIDDDKYIEKYIMENYML